MRAPHWLAFYGLVVAGWAGLWLMTAAPAGPGTGPLAALVELCRAGAARADLAILVAMWALMSAAMMAPTAVPAIATWEDLARAGAGTRGGFWALIAGYLAVWLGFSLLAALAQKGLAALALIDGAGRAASPWLTAGLLAFAGAYQFSALKAACLSACRHPLTFFMEHWRPGPGAALVMGLRLGAVCLGCCWALMLLAFAGGVTSLAWMGAATVLMTLEKLPELGRPITAPLGWALLAAAALVAAGALGAA
ncbi:MAG: DUF2182 domain-containing protein [Alphaproteobacteria bacterium]|nr:MAG: DUF2182 domain-containing protein [Alphaproteobacteria bacterium]